jgi:hypothetical protein
LAAAERGPAEIGDDPGCSPRTWNGRCTGLPRRNGSRGRTRILALALPPTGTARDSGTIWKPSRPSLSDAERLSRTGVLPQLVYVTVCRADHRAFDVTGAIVGCRSNTRPTSRSPSSTTPRDGSSVEIARTPNGSACSGALACAGGVRTTTAVASSPG